MGDAGEGLVDAESRLAERMEEREQEKRKARQTAKSGDPVLFTHRDSLPAATRAAIAAHQQPRIYVLGPSSVISPDVTRELRKLGTVIRVGLPEWSQKLGEAEVAQVTRNIVDILRGVPPRIRSEGER